MTAEGRPHQRRNLLTGDRVLVSPHRAQRPWHGETEIAARSPTRHHDPNCYLCPGNLRVSAVRTFGTTRGVN